MYLNVFPNVILYCFQLGPEGGQTLTECSCVCVSVSVMGQFDPT